MKILIFGTGGLGCFFGAHLNKINCDVTFLVREKYIETLTKNGIKITSDFGNFKIKPKMITKEQIKPIYDIIILACKSYSLKESIRDLKPIKGHGIIIPLLNGYTHLSDLDKNFKKENVFGGVAHVSSNTTELGHVNHIGQIKRLSFGTRHKTNKTVAKQFFEICKKADFQIIFSKNINQDIWEKWIFLATIAGATTLFRTSIDKISNNDSGSKFIGNLWNECINLSRASGIILSDESKKLHGNLLFSSNSNFKASMLIDMEKKRSTEYKHIFYEFIKLGNKINFKTPFLDLVYLNMKIYEENLN